MYFALFTGRKVNLIELLTIFLIYKQFGVCRMDLQMELGKILVKKPKPQKG